MGVQYVVFRVHQQIIVILEREKWNEKNRLSYAFPQFSNRGKRLTYEYLFS